MKILICNERFLFRFGVDRVLLMLGSYWRQAGHQVIMMGNKLDALAVDKCSDSFIYVPEAPDYLHGNDYTLEYLQLHWDEWFEEGSKPDVALVAGWPFYNCIKFFRDKLGTVIFQDYGAVPLDGMSEPQKITQLELRRLRKENLKYATEIVAISSFLEETQSKKDVLGTKVPTAYVHLGVDHLDLHLWDKKELNISQNDVVSDIGNLKKNGYKIIFQPGRWENGNYKNSNASIKIAQELERHKIKHKILVLSSFDNMDGVSDAVKASYYCLGYIDDNTMRQVMELSDVGISPTLWEGFDLPLGEMQYLERPMFVLDVGAHPEVALDGYFLCSDIDEMAKKIIDYFEGYLPFTSEEFIEKCNSFKQTFTWENSSIQLMKEIKKSVKENQVVFIDVTNACHDTANSGVMRVTRKISHYIQTMMDTVFVLWDDSINRYVFPYDEEIDILCSYGGPSREAIRYKSQHGKQRSVLDNVINEFSGRKKNHIFTETVNYHVLQTAICYMRGFEMTIAAIFYDAIPVLRPDLCSKEVAENHWHYMLELANCDVVIPIANHNGENLRSFWKEKGVHETCIKSLELAAEMDGVERVKDISADDNDLVRILFVSTLEPRKNHIRFLKSLELLFDKYPYLQKCVVVHLVGNKYAGNDEIPTFVNEFCDRHENVKWLGVVDDESLKREYKECTFTVYPSEIEGYGMPIIESLWNGKPCLCNKEGSIGELAGKGGCCLTDVLSEESIAEALFKMVTDKGYFEELQQQAISRKIITWNEYVNDLSDIFCELRPEEYRRIPIELRRGLAQHFSGNLKKRVIIVSNFYPPSFIGGAEIIAHNQSKVLDKSNEAKVIIFSLDMSPTNVPGNVVYGVFEDILVVRFSTVSNRFNMDGINFFDRDINAVFHELCGIVLPDIVHFHNIIGMSLGMVDIAKTAGAKTVVTLHDNWGFCFKNTMLDEYGKLCANVFNCHECKSVLSLDGMNIPIETRKDYFRRTFEKIDAYISPSKYLANTYLRAGFDFHKMNVIWNGIDVNRFEKVEKIPADKIRITTVACFGKHKGIETLIKAVGVTGRTDIEINLVGTGPEENNYRKTATECGVLHQLRFWGHLANRDIENVYAETDIYCLPSIWPENQPVSITEALACGIPVIASNLGGNSELVVDGVNGFLFDSGDENNLAEKITVLANDEQLRTKMGNEARKSMMTNTYECQVAKICNLYESTEKRSCRSKKIIAVKGMRFPLGINRVTHFDVIQYDWIDQKSEWGDVVAFVLLPTEKLEKSDRQLLKKTEVKVLVPKSEYNQYYNQGLRVIPYSDNGELLEKLSQIKE